MKRKINYQITIGSVWPKEEDLIIKRMGDIQFPSGGTMENVEFEYEAKTPEISMDDAESALELYMANHHPGKTYHIWYWTWLA